MSLPKVVITSKPLYLEVSKISGWDTAEFTFQSDQEFQEYKVCLVSNTSDPHTEGIVIPTTHGSVNMHDVGAFPPYTSISCIIKSLDLELVSPGDGVKTIKVFVKDQDGNWSN